jgi:glycosyltransferase involved in cell wall biosynthesis
MNISVIIPTFRREQVLLDTLSGLIKQIEPGDEILVMDQTPLHEHKTESQLGSWNSGGTIRWIRLKEPSIPGSMNQGALEAKNELLLFLDDDIIPDADLLNGHRQAYRAQDTWAVVGGVTQPGQTDDARQVTEVMAGNLSVLRSRFLDVGGFDENFKAVAYRFEKEFGERLVERGGKILFEPSAGIRHLQAGTGGVRCAGKHTSSILPYHSVGEYYYFFRSNKIRHKLLRSLGRFFASVCTKHHLLKPWWIPVTLIAEARGFFWGLSLYFQGPRLLKSGKIKLAVFSPYPIQYYSVWFRALAEKKEIDFKVYYGFIPSDEQQGYGFGATFKWDVPVLEGYKWEVVHNARKNPGFYSFFGSSTPGIKKVFAKDRPDAIILIGWSFWPLVQALMACRKLKIPTIVRGDSNNLKKRNFIVRLAHRVLLPMYDAYLGVGILNRQFYLGYGVPEEKIFRARHFVDNAFFETRLNEIKGQRQALRAEWNIRQDAVCFLFAGKLQKVKMALDLFRAFEIARRRNSAMHLLIAGDGEQMRQLQDFARERGLPVTFTGFLNQREIGKAYLAADCLVLPSSPGETWGLVVNEAFIFGLPAIVSDGVGCYPDLIIEGKTGTVFPRRNIPVLADKLVEFARDPAKLKTMGLQAKELIKDYSVDDTVKGTMEALRYILKMRGDPRVDH